MSYVALYRKFRPSRFSEVKGQDHIVTTLRNQLISGRVGHAYLFTGTRGTGKTTIARIMARSINCEHPTDDGPCGECDSCRSIADGSSLNVYEIDGASNNGVDNVRAIIESVTYRPTLGKYKVYIIDEVHMITNEALNALLKTLEEPPEWVVFILATTELHKLTSTVVSRCQRYEFRRIGIESIVQRMKELMEAEGREIDERALTYIARKADGSMRDALSLLDQTIAFRSEGAISYDETLEVLGAVDTEVFSRLYNSIISRNATSCIGIIDEITMQGKDITQFLTDFVWYLRNIMLMCASPDTESLIDISSGNMKRLKEDVAVSELDNVIRYVKVFSEVISQIRYATQKRVYVEIACIRCCEPRMSIKDPEALTDRVAALEEKLKSGNFAFAAVPEQTGDGEKTPEKAVVQRAEMPKAVPDDIRTLIEHWSDILADSNNEVRAILRNCKPVLGDDDKLVLYLPHGNVATVLLEQPENKKNLDEVFENQVGKAVEYSVRQTESEDMFDNGIYDLRNLVKPGTLNVPIETADETEEF